MGIGCKQTDRHPKPPQYGNNPKQFYRRSLINLSAFSAKPLHYYQHLRHNRRTTIINYIMAGAYQNIEVRTKWRGRYINDWSHHRATFSGLIQATEDNRCSPPNLVIYQLDTSARDGRQLNAIRQHGALYGNFTSVTLTSGAVIALQHLDPMPIGLGAGLGIGGGRSATSSAPSGGGGWIDELAYGIWESSNFTISVAPEAHYDANILDGADSANNPSDGAAVSAWNDRSGSTPNYNATRYWIASTHL